MQYHLGGGNLKTIFSKLEDTCMLYSTAPLTEAYHRNWCSGFCGISLHRYNESMGHSNCEILKILIF
jgi:hypothetical protein